MDDRDKIIISAVLSIVGVTSIIFIVYLIIWFVLRRKSKSTNHVRNPSIPYRQRFERSQNAVLTRLDSNKRRKRKRRFNTNDSAISFSFNPPHLINQNVKNLDKLLPLESSSPTNLWPHQDVSMEAKTNNFNRYFSPSSNNNIVHTSSSSLSSPISNLTPGLPYCKNLNALQFRYLNELNQHIILKQGQKPTSALKYSQSCRQANDPLPFNFFRSMESSMIMNNENSPGVNHVSMSKYSNATLLRKAQLGQLRDDTAILY